MSDEDRTAGVTLPGHAHDAWQCPAHGGGCSCTGDLDASLCNPYRVPGHRPDDLTVMPDDPRAVP